MKACPRMSTEGNKVVCMEDDCAWWSASYECCSVSLLAVTALDLGRVLDSIDAALRDGLTNISARLAPRLNP